MALIALTACGTFTEDTKAGPSQDQARLHAGDVGSVGVPGSHQLEGGLEPLSANAVRVAGAGSDIWGEEDGFHYAYWAVEGDVVLEARVVSVEDTDPWAKAGLMIRATLDADARNTMIALTAAGRTTFQHRQADGELTVSTRVDDLAGPLWLRLSRRGGETTGAYSLDRSSWTAVDVADLDLPETFFVGFAVTSHAYGTLAEGVFENVELTLRESRATEGGETEGGADEDGEPDDGPEPKAPTAVDDGGLHYSQAELAQWRIRAESGPYRTKGDVSQNSPGDWTRIRDQADDFLADPGWRHWLGNTSDSCYEWGDPAPSNDPSTNLRDAAFVYLVTSDTRYRDAVRDELLALAREPGLDLSNETRWCTGSLRDGNPALEIGNWFSQLLVAYDYLGDDSFSAEQRATLDAWFGAAGHFFADEVHASLDKNFVDRLSNDYRLTSYAGYMNASTTTTSHYGGRDIYSLAKFYNNRRATSARFFGLVGIKIDDPELTSQAERFVREYLAYGTYPDGIVGDFERWTTSFPDLGWDYAAAALSSVITLADAFARAGDTSLYAYSTTDGYFGTQSTDGTPKTLLLAIRNHQSYLLSATHRYASHDADDVGDHNLRIDGAHAPRSWYSIADVTLLPANLYYRDATIQSIYLREHPDTDPYPEQPASRGHAPAWNGDWGLYPGLFFMYAGLEDEASPFY